MFQNRPPSYKNTQYIDLTKTRAVPNIQQWHKNIMKFMQ